MKLMLRRMLAEVIDLSLCWLVSLLPDALLPFAMSRFLFSGLLQETGWMLPLAVVYETLMTSICGDTVGKRLMRICVRTNDDMDFSLSRSFLRALIKNATIFFLYGIFAALSVLYMTQDLHSSIHDRLIGTGVWKRRSM